MNIMTNTNKMLTIADVARRLGIDAKKARAAMRKAGVKPSARKFREGSDDYNLVHAFLAKGSKPATSKLRTRDREEVVIRAMDDEGVMRSFKKGQMVGFKSDIEQYGVIVGFRNVSCRQAGVIDLVVEPAGDHFDGEYLRTAKNTILESTRVWVDEG